MSKKLYQFIITLDKNNDLKDDKNLDSIRQLATGQETQETQETQEPSENSEIPENNEPEDNQDNVENNLKETVSDN